MNKKFGISENMVHVVRIEGFNSSGDYAEHMYTTTDLFWKAEDANKYAKIMLENAQIEEEHITVEVYTQKIR
jgi:hypothetical protein